MGLTWKDNNRYVIASNEEGRVFGLIRRNSETETYVAYVARFRKIENHLTPSGVAAATTLYSDLNDSFCVLAYYVTEADARRGVERWAEFQVIPEKP